MLYLCSAGRRKVYKSGVELSSNPIPFEADGFASTYSYQNLGKGGGEHMWRGERAKVGWGGGNYVPCNPSSDGSVVR